MDYVIPAGRFRGRLLGSLTEAEKIALRRTRVADLHQARSLIGQPAAPPAAAPQPPAGDPPPVVPLTLARLPRQRWPPERAPAPVTAQRLRVRILKWLVCLVLLLVHPPLAQIPGRLVGYVLRVLALRCRDVWGHFVDSFVTEMSGLGWDLLEWIETTLMPWPQPSAAPAAMPGQRLGTVVVGLLALRIFRPWQ